MFTKGLPEGYYEDSVKIYEEREKWERELRIQSLFYLFC